MCSGWCNNWVTRQHARYNNEKKEQNLQQVRKCEGHLLWNCVMSWKLYWEKLGVGIKKYRTGLGQGTVTTQRKPVKLTKKLFILFIRAKSRFSLQPLPLIFLFFLNSTVIINSNPLEANYDLQMANPFSSALEGRGPLFR